MGLIDGLIGQYLQSSVRVAQTTALLKSIKEGGVAVVPLLPQLKTPYSIKLTGFDGVAREARVIGMVLEVRDRGNSQYVPVDLQPEVIDAEGIEL